MSAQKPDPRLAKLARTYNEPPPTPREKMWAEMDRKGIRQERLQLDWFTAAEGQKFADKIEEISKIAKTVTPEEIATAVAAYKENKENKKIKAA